MNLINKFLVIALMTASFLCQAQLNQGPWSVSFGLNAVDTRVSAGGNVNFIDNKVSQPLLISKNWNLYPAFYLSVDREVLENFSLGLEASTNKISKFVTFNGSQYVTSNPGDLRYYGLDGVAKYSLMSLIHSKVIDPNLAIGGGLTVMDPYKYIHFNLGLKINFWLSNTLAITAGSTYKASQILGSIRNVGNQPVEPSYVQHTLGLTYNFGSKDADKDGVPDEEDSCPSIKGLKELKGCPDSDGDGVTDMDDKCPLVRGTVELNGCADRDDDGVADDEDACPDQAGDKLLKGCPDSDKDGVADGEDKCPNQYGPKENNGCPWPDADKDGVPDKDDLCPQEAGTKSSKGCPEKEVVKQITQDAIDQISEYSKQILFSSGKFLYKDKIVPVLESIVSILKQFPDAKFIIEGHTDSDGSYSSNLKLSQKRADAVKDYLVEKGISEDRLSTVGMSESSPVASNKTQAGKALNRRTEVKIVK